MKHAGSIALGDVSLDEQAAVREVNRKGFVMRMLVALHRSRRRQARQLVRHYRHLIAEDLRGFNREKESNRNASGDEAFDRSGHGIVPGT